MKSLAFLWVLASVLTLSRDIFGQHESPGPSSRREDFAAAHVQPGARQATKGQPIGTPGDERTAAIHIEKIRNADFLEFGSVGFYPNAVVIRRAFESEMSSLATYLKENPTYSLVIHGHCNGNAPRTIIALGASRNFFELTCENEIKNVSAQELSRLRAENARRYLLGQGIESERIVGIGEAGKAMIYPLTSLHAHYNDRIEFEIVRWK